MNRGQQVFLFCGQYYVLGVYLSSLDLGSKTQLFPRDKLEFTDLGSAHWVISLNLLFFTLPEV